MALLTSKNNVQLSHYMPPAVDGGPRIPVFHITTNDNEAAIETNGWADDLPGAATLPVGTVLIVLADLDGTPKLFNYLITTNSAGDITLTQQTHASA